MAIGQLAYGLDRRSPVSHSGVPGVFGYRGMAKRKPKPSGAGRASDRLNIRIDLASGVRIGPGKVAVSEAIARSGSISAAGRALRMSYRRTWELVEDLNTGPGTPVVEAAAGGSGGGGAVLTPAGRAVIERYRAIELDTALAARTHLIALARACANQQ
jgi:molybdate transport system regulatory protein